MKVKSTVGRHFSAVAPKFLRLCPRAGLGWAGLGWAGLGVGWAGLDWAGLVSGPRLEAAVVLTLARVTV